MGKVYIEVNDFNKQFEDLKQEIKSLKDKIDEMQYGIPEDKLMTRQEVADYFCVSIPTIHEWIHNDILKSYKTGNKTFFKQAEVKAALIPQSNIRRKRLKDIIKKNI